MRVSLSLRDYARTHPGPVSWRRRLRLDPQHTCEVRVEQDMVYESPDGRAFQVRRLGCDGCGRRWRDVRELEVAFGPPTLRRGGGAFAAAANF